MQGNGKEPKLGAPAPVPSEPASEQEIMSRWVRGDSGPLVSVIIHTYQHLDYVKDALNGVLVQQTDFPFEVIVHDDASTDGTQDVLRSYKERYPNIIHLILQEQNQFSKGRRPPEFTFPVANGRYLALCEGDDYWLDESKLQRQFDLMESDPGCAVCGHDAFVLKNGIVENLSKLPDRRKVDLAPKWLQRRGFVLTLSMMFVNRIHDFPPEQLQVLSGDKFLLSRLGAFGGYRHIGDITPAAYRIHPSGIWSSLDQEKKDLSKINTLYWMARYYRRIGNGDLECYFTARIAEQVLARLEKVKLKEVLTIIRILVQVYLGIRFPNGYARLRRVHVLLRRMR